MEHKSFDDLFGNFLDDWENSPSGIAERIEEEENMVVIRKIQQATREALLKKTHIKMPIAANVMFARFPNMSRMDRYHPKPLLKIFQNRVHYYVLTKNSVLYDYPSRKNNAVPHGIIVLPPK